MGERSRREACRRLGIAVAAVVGAAVLLPPAASAGTHGKTGLVVHVTGLPKGAIAAVRVTGPESFKRTISRVGVTRISLARAGRYRIILKSVRLRRGAPGVKAGAVAYPVAKRLSVIVVGGKAQSVTAAYGTIVNPGLTPLRDRILRVIGDSASPDGLVLKGSSDSPKAGQTLSVAPSDTLPHGVLSRVTGVSVRSGNAVVRLRAVPVSDVAPVLQFDIPAQIAGPAGSAASASCSATNGISPYNEISNIHLSGKVVTLSWLGPGVDLRAAFDVRAGVNVSATLGVTCSLSAHAIPVRGVVPPGIPIYGTITAGLSASLQAGAQLDAGVTVPVTLGGRSIGAPPNLLWAPTIEPGAPKFTSSVKAVAELTAGASLGAEVGIGDPDIGNVHISLDNSLDFSARIGACAWDLNLGRFSGGGKLGIWSISTPKTPAIYHKHLWDGCHGNTGGTDGGGGGGSGGAAIASLLRATGVSAGAAHTCALLASGNVDCWGANNVGALGDGTTTNSSTPVRVRGISTATAISAGNTYTCALLASGSINCWGTNFMGVLGDGTTTNSSTPVRVQGISTATAISAGDGDHTCALLADHHVDCWGSNASGQLGDGTTDDSLVPVEVSGITSATAVSAGDRYTCALLLNHHVVCWGLNTVGQLGDGTGSPSPTPISVVGLTDATTIVASVGDTCAVRAGGGIACWGGNSDGQLGVGATPDFSPTPLPVVGIATAKAVDLGYGTTCALLVSGNVDCWGLAHEGELGNGTTPFVSLTPGPVDRVTQATGITVGDEHACALIAGGEVDCWGGNASGQVGDGTTTMRPSPIAVRTAP